MSKQRTKGEKSDYPLTVAVCKCLPHYTFSPVEVDTFNVCTCFDWHVCLISVSDLSLQ